MSTERFNVVFEGTTRPAHDPATVAAKLAAIINRDVEFAGRLLSGRPTTLKSGVDATTGERYVSALERAGVAVHLEPETLEVDADLRVPESSTEYAQRTDREKVVANYPDPAAAPDQRVVANTETIASSPKVGHATADGASSSNANSPHVAVRPAVVAGQKGDGPERQTATPLVGWSGSAAMNPRLQTAKKYFFIALTIDIAVTTVFTIADFWAIDFLQDSAGDPLADQSTLSTMDAWASFSTVMILTTIGVGITLVRWLGACYEYAKEGLKATGFVQERWKTWGWIVPIMNAFKPYQVLGEIYRAGNANYIASEEWKNSSGSGTLLVWWIFWVIAHLIMWVIARQSLSTAQVDFTLDQMIGMYYGNVVACITSLLVAGSWFIVASRLSERLLRRSATLGDRDWVSGMQAARAKEFPRLP